MHRQLKHRLVFSLGVILFAAFTLVTVMNYTATRSSLTREIVNSSLPLLRENIYSELQRSVLPSLNIASMMATDSFLKNWSLEGEKNQNAIHQYLTEIQTKYNYKSVFFVSARTNRYYHPAGILKNLSLKDPHDIWFYNFRDGGKPYTLDVDNDEAAANRLTIFINYRVNDYAGNFLGVAGVGIVMEDFSHLLTVYQQKYQRRIYFTDRRGLIVAHSEPALVRHQTLQSLPGINAAASKILKTGRQPLDTEYEGPNGQVLLTVCWIPEMDWFLLVEMDEGQALAGSIQTLVQTLAIGLAATVLILILSLITVNRYHRELEKLAVTDSLTGCLNRREWAVRLGRMLYRRVRYRRPISMIIFDVDGFKEINDTHGHQAGDRVLVELAALAEADKRPDDCLGRLGGDEFVVVMEGGAAEAQALAERLRQSFRWYAQQNYPDIPHLGISLGIAEAEDNDSSERLIQKADQALYTAKNRGKNRSVIFGKPTSPEESGSSPDWGL